MGKKNKERNRVYTSLVQEDKSDYKILSYFLKEPTVGFTCISALVVVLTFLVNIAAYLRESAYLNYWNLDVRFTSLSRPNQLYYVIGTILYSILVAVGIFVIVEAYETLIPAKKIVRYFKRKDKEVRIMGQKSTARFIKLNKKYKKYRAKHPEEDTRETARELRELKRQVASLNKLMESSEQKTREIKKITYAPMKWHFLIAVIIFSLGDMFLMVFTGSFELDAFKLFFRATLGATIMAVLAYMASMAMHLSNFATDDEENDELFNKYCEELENNKQEYPISREWKTYFKDSSMKTTFLGSIAYAVLLLLLFSFMGTDDAKRKDTFPVIHLDGQSYVSIYSTDEVVILEKCQIADTEDGFEVTIAKQEQRIIPADDFAYEIVEFVDVNVVDNLTKPSQ